MAERGTVAPAPEPEPKKDEKAAAPVQPAPALDVKKVEQGGILLQQGLNWIIEGKVSEHIGQFRKSRNKKAETLYKALMLAYKDNEPEPEIALMVITAVHEQVKMAVLESVGIRKG
jgi:hypothetical protein